MGLNRPEWASIGLNGPYSPPSKIEYCRVIIWAGELVIVFFAHK